MVEQNNPKVAIQVISINGTQSTIRFEKRKTGGFGLENEHRTKKSKLGERNFQLLKKNRVLLDLLYVQRFIGWLKDAHNVNLIEITPQALCEIISVLLEQPKTRKIRDEIVSYSYSDKTYVYAHFFDLLFGSFQDLDKEGTMRTLRTLKTKSKEEYLRYNQKRIHLPKRESEEDKAKKLIFESFNRTPIDNNAIGKEILKLKRKFGSIKKISQELGVSEDWLNYYLAHLDLNQHVQFTIRSRK